MIVAIPIGMMTAVYLTQYAAPVVRKWVKPILEILAGVPTVVYGYFAALTVAPALRNFAVMPGIPNASTESALAAGIRSEERRVGKECVRKCRSRWSPQH